MLAYSQIKAFTNLYQAMEHSAFLRNYCAHVQGLAFPCYNNLNESQYKLLKCWLLKFSQITELGAGNGALSLQLEHAKQRSIIEPCYDLAHKKFTWLKCQYHEMAQDLTTEVTFAVDSLYGVSAKEFKSLFSKLDTEYLIVIQTQLKSLFKNFFGTDLAGMLKSQFNLLESHDFSNDMENYWQKSFQFLSDYSEVPKNCQIIFNAKMKETRRELKLYRQKAACRVFLIFKKK